MGVLYLENVPDELLKCIERVAVVKKVPVPEAAVQLLQQAVSVEPAAQERPRQSVGEILAWIKAHRITPKPDTPDSVEMLREDRAR